jgi:FkbM family methyltransferase
MAIKRNYRSKSSPTTRVSALFDTLNRIRKAARANGLARSHKMRVFTRFVTLQARARLVGKPILVPFVGTTRIFAGAGYTGSNGNYYLGLHEFEDMAFMLHYLRPVDLFIDVGANVGSYTLIASSAVGARTVAFEPVPQTLTRLRANCNVNGITSLVDIRAVCVGDQNGTANFSVDADTTNSIVADSGLRPRIQVPLRRLDSEINEAPTAIKIDAEGYDDNVLEGAAALLKEHHPLAMLVESLGGGSFGRNMIESESRLVGFGFARCRYDPWRRAIEKTTDLSIYNHLFVRDLEFAQARVASAPRFGLNGFGEV